VYIRGPGRQAHYPIDTFQNLEEVMRWANPWQERICEEASDADEKRRAGVNAEAVAKSTLFRIASQAAASR